MGKNKDFWERHSVAAFFLALLGLFSPYIIIEFFMPYWRASGGFSGPAGLAIIILISLAILGAAGFIIGWSVKKGIQVADEN